MSLFEPRWTENTILAKTPTRRYFITTKDHANENQFPGLQRRVTLKDCLNKEIKIEFDYDDIPVLQKILTLLKE
jgi:hypothetical protein